MASSIRPRGLSRRDHVLNLLPPLTVVNKEDATLHDRLFSDDPPAKNYPKSFPSKVLRHLGEWTFYSAPTKGELALLDKNMYDSENDTENPNKNDTDEKKTEHEKHTPGAQSQYADDEKTLETRKGKTLKAKRGKQKQQTKDEEKIFKEEANEVVEHQTTELPPETTQGKSSKANSLEATKHVGGKKGNNIEATKSTKKKTQRQSYVTCASKKLKKNAEVKNMKSQPPLAKVEIPLKKSRGKVLGGAESGDEISTEALTVEGHNISVPGSDQKHGHTKERTHDIERTGAHIKQTVKLSTTERKDGEVKRRNRSFTSVTDTADLDADNKKTVVPEKAQLGNPKRSVIKIPLQEIDSSEEADNNNRVMTPESEAKLDIKSENIDSASELQTKVDSPFEEQSENAVKSKASPENFCGNLGNDVLLDKRVTFGPSSQKELENITTKGQSPKMDVKKNANGVAKIG